MIFLNGHFGVAIFAFLLSLLFAEGSWARSHLHVSGLEATQPRALGKRALSDTQYLAYQIKGIEMSCATQMSDATASTLFFDDKSLVATALTVDQLTDAGWEINAKPTTTLAEKLPDYLGDAVLALTGLTLANNVVRDWQWVVTGDNGNDITSNYQCWYNVAGGAIFVDLAWGPAFKQAEAEAIDNWPEDVGLPAIQQLSDVMWIEWANQAGDSAANLNYIFQMDVVNFVTRDIINTAMGSTYWTGFQEFAQDDAGFNALLGSPNGGAQGWVLLNHQATLGIKTITTIRVWSSSAFSGNQKIPNDDVGDGDTTDNDTLCWVEGQEGEAEDGSDDIPSAYRQCYHMLFIVGDPSTDAMDTSA